MFFLPHKPRVRVSKFQAASSSEMPAAFGRPPRAKIALIFVTIALGSLGQLVLALGNHFALALALAFLFPEVARTSWPGEHTRLAQAVVLRHKGQHFNDDMLLSFRAKESVSPLVVDNQIFLLAAHGCILWPTKKATTQLL